MIVPVEWQLLLSRIQHRAPEAMIAGGALRDLDNDRPVKDIDVFFEDPSFGRKRAEVITAALAAHPLITGGDHEPYLKWDSDVRQVWTFEDPTEEMPELNLIMLAPGTCTVEKQMARFDFGICRIAYTGGHFLTKHRDYEFDKAAKAFTLRWGLSAEQRNNSLARFDRLKAKYPDWILIEEPAPEVMSLDDWF